MTSTSSTAPKTLPMPRSPHAWSRSCLHRNTDPRDCLGRPQDCEQQQAASDQSAHALHALNQENSSAVADRGRIASHAGAPNPHALAEQLGIPFSQLAELVGVSRSTLAAAPLGKKGREALLPLLRLLVDATEMAGTLERAVSWFKHTPIASLEDRTAMELVRTGNIAAVQGHLRNLADSAYT